MIQRIQSLYLAVAAVLGTIPIIVLNLPISEDPLMNSIIKALLQEAIILYTSICTVFVLLSIATIFLFKKRTLQIKFCISMIIYLLLLMGLSIINSINHSENKNYASEAFIAILLLLVYLALRAIKKDEELVRSVDRIR